MSTAGRIPRHRSLWRITGWLLTLIGAMLAHAEATATVIPIAKGTTYVLPLGDHDVRDVLSNFGKATGIAVNVAPSVTGKISGTGQAQGIVEFLDAVATRASLNYFSFRNILYFSRAQDAIESTIDINAGQQGSIKTALANMRLLDDKFSWIELPGRNQVLLFGPATYVQFIRQNVVKIAGHRQMPAVVPSADPVEVMIFKLNFASAADKAASVDGVPAKQGVVSVLRSIYGMGDLAYSSRPSLYSPYERARSAPRTLVKPTSTSPTMADRTVSVGKSRVPAIATISSDRDVGDPRTSDPLTMQLEDQMFVASRAETILENTIAPIPRERSQSDTSTAILADERTNAIIIRDRRSKRPEYERIIAALDIPAQQLEVETIVVDMFQEDLVKSLARLPRRDASVGESSSNAFIVLSRNTADALLSYSRAIARKDRAGKADVTVLSQTVVFKQDDAFTLDFSDEHAYPQLSIPFWKRMQGELVSTAMQPDSNNRATSVHIAGNAQFSGDKIEIRAAIQESRERPDLRNKTVDRRQTALQMSVALNEGDVCVLSNTSYFVGLDATDSRGRLILLSARRHFQNQPSSH